MLTRIDLIDELKGDFAIRKHHDIAANLMLFKRFANESDIRPIIFDQYKLARCRRRLRFIGMERLGG